MASNLESAGAESGFAASRSELDLADYVGVQIMGNWQVCVGDSAGGDTGAIDGAMLTIKY